MVDFAAHFTTKILHFTWKMLSLKVVHLPIACQSERSLRYFNQGRISSFAIHRSSSQALLAAEKIFGFA